MPCSKDFVRVFVNIMSLCYFCGKLLCRILVSGHISYLLLGETSPVFVCMRVCGYSHNDLLINAIIFITIIMNGYRSGGPISPSLITQTWRL